MHLQHCPFVATKNSFCNFCIMNILTLGLCKKFLRNAWRVYLQLYCVLFTTRDVRTPDIFTYPHSSGISTVNYCIQKLISSVMAKHFVSQFWKVLFKERLIKAIFCFIEYLPAWILSRDVLKISNVTGYTKFNLL